MPFRKSLPATRSSVFSSLPGAPLTCPPVPPHPPPPAAEVLDLMGSMLGFSPEDRAKIVESRRQQGWRDISLSSDVQLAGGAARPAGKQSLADSWIDFLETQLQAEADAAAQRSGGGAAFPLAAGGAGTPTASAAQEQQHQPVVL